MVDKFIRPSHQNSSSSGFIFLVYYPDSAREPLDSKVGVIISGVKKENTLEKPGQRKRHPPSLCSF